MFITRGDYSAGFIFMPTYLSKQGLEDLKAEHTKRLTQIRKEIAEKISAAKDLATCKFEFLIIK